MPALPLVLRAVVFFFAALREAPFVFFTDFLAAAFFGDFFVAFGVFFEVFFDDFFGAAFALFFALLAAVFLVAALAPLAEAFFFRFPTLS